MQVDVNSEDYHPRLMRAWCLCRECARAYLVDVSAELDHELDVARRMRAERDRLETVVHDTNRELDHAPNHVIYRETLHQHNRAREELLKVETYLADQRRIINDAIATMQRAVTLVRKGGDNLWVNQ